MSDQASNTMPQEKIQMKMKKDVKKRKHSPHSEPADSALADLAMYDLSDSTPLDRKEMETPKPGLDKSLTGISRKITDEEMSLQRKAALEYLDKAREAVSAIKAQTSEKNFDLKSVFPFMDLPFLEFPFIETPLKPEQSEGNVTCVSQGQQTEADDLDASFAKLTIKSETPIKTEPKMVSASQDQQGKQDEQGEKANLDNIFTDIKAESETPEQHELGVGSVSQAQQGQQGEEAQDNVIITPAKATTAETSVMTEPSEL